VKLVPREIETKLNIPIGGNPVFRVKTLQLQPEVIPAVDQDFTFGGKCTVTSSQFGTSIVGHSCLYDLCLGRSTDCIFVYAGTRFEFFPLSNDREQLIGAQNKGLLDPTTIDQGLTDDNLRTGRARRSVLPPSFPGFVFGGVGAYEGIKGSFDLITVAQRSGNPLPQERTEPPTAAPTLTDAPTPDFQNGRDLQEENEERRTATISKDDLVTQSSSNNDIKEEDENNNEEQQQQQEQRDLQRDTPFVTDDSILEQFDDAENVIVQKIFLVTNLRLPLGPKAI
jgi:hypothetical protein